MRYPALTCARGRREGKSGMLEIYQALARRTGCPDEFLPELSRIVPSPDAPYVLWCAGDDWVNPSRLAGAFGTDLETAAELLEDLFRRGILARRRPADLDRDEFWYHARSFYSLLLIHLGEGRVDGLDRASLVRLREFYLTRRLEMYDDLIEEGALKASSEVLPVEEAFTGHRHPHSGETTVMPGVDAHRLMAATSALQLLPCACRLTFQRCDKPLETCLILGSRAEEYRARGVGRPITVDEGEEILRIADREGLVHLAVFEPGDRPYALCSCCPCCCHDLQALLRFGRTRWVRKAPWVARTDMDVCTGCGTCVLRCVFGARVLGNGVLAYDEARCYGCGLCVNTCPQRAITLVPRAPA
ncbi:MAG: 4Fe-4S binding protein [Bacillota bacterium]|nr:4Fe-4S binding protein [Bacillota bacterium]